MKVTVNRPPQLTSVSLEMDSADFKVFLEVIGANNTVLEALRSDGTENLMYCKDFKDVEAGLDRIWDSIPDELLTELEK